jgi:hypothetical protein
MKSSLKKLMGATAIAAGAGLGAPAVAAQASSGYPAAWQAYSAVDSQPQVSHALMFSTMEDFANSPEAACVWGGMDRVWLEGNWTASGLQAAWNSYAQQALQLDPAFANLVVKAVLSVVPGGSSLPGRLVAKAANELAGRIINQAADRYFESFALGANLDFLAADVATTPGVTYGRLCSEGGQV